VSPRVRETGPAPPTKKRPNFSMGTVSAALGANLCATVPGPHAVTRSQSPRAIDPRLAAARPRVPAGPVPSGPDRPAAPLQRDPPNPEPAPAPSASGGSGAGSGASSELRCTGAVVPSGGGSPGGSRTLEVERHECAAPAAAGAAGVDGDAEFNVLLQDSAGVEEREGETPRRESLRMEDVTMAEENPPLPPSGIWRSNQGGGALDRVRRLEDDICASQVAEAKAADGAAADLLHHESRLPIGQREGSPACRLQPAPEAAAAAAAAGVSRLPRKRPRAAPPPNKSDPRSYCSCPDRPKGGPGPTADYDHRPTAPHPTTTIPQSAPDQRCRVTRRKQGRKQSQRRRSCACCGDSEGWQSIQFGSTATWSRESSPPDEEGTRSVAPLNEWGQGDSGDGSRAGKWRQPLVGPEP